MPTRLERIRKERRRRRELRNAALSAPPPKKGGVTECRAQKKKARLRGMYAEKREEIKAACRKASKVRYDTDPAFREAKKACSRGKSKAQYQANPEAKKVRSRANSRAKYQANPEVKKISSRINYKNSNKRLVRKLHVV